MLTVSGLSSGAFFATQTHVAFSSLIEGAAIFAGGIYYGAQGNVVTALTIMDHPQTINIPLIFSQVLSLQNLGYIDPVSNLSQHPVWLFSGTKDSTVNPQNSIVSSQLYELLKCPAHVNVTIAAEHAFPTNTFGSNCHYNGSPYINQCGFDGVHEAFRQVFHAHIRRPVDYIEANLFKIDQYAFVPPVFDPTVATNGVARTGYVYIPTNCRARMMRNPLFTSRLYTETQDGTLEGKELLTLREEMWDKNPFKTALTSASTSNDVLSIAQSLRETSSTDERGSCRVHIAAHGCKQTLTHIGETYIRRTGYLQYSESNDVIVFFPQATTTVTNPNGCFDWWGYSGPMYHTKLGVQPLTFMNIATSLQAGL